MYVRFSFCALLCIWQYVLLIWLELGHSMYHCMCLSPLSPYVLFALVYCLCYVYVITVIWHVSL